MYSPVAACGQRKPTIAALLGITLWSSWPAVNTIYVIKTYMYKRGVKTACVWGSTPDARFQCLCPHSRLPTTLPLDSARDFHSIRLYVTLPSDL